MISEITFALFRVCLIQKFKLFLLCSIFEKLLFVNTLLMGSYFPKLFEMNFSYKDENYDSLKTFSEYVMGFGYRMEEHKVLTKDGYILSLFRIAGRITDTSRKKKPVLLMHGAYDSAFTFFINSQDSKNLPFKLSEEGYEIWQIGRASCRERV